MPLGELEAGARTIEDAEAFRPITFARSTPSCMGAAKVARPVSSVVTRTPPLNSTTSPGARWPDGSSTASVARCPVTTLPGSTSVAPGGAAAVACLDGVFAVVACQDSAPVPHAAKAIVSNQEIQTPLRGNLCARIMWLIVTL